MPFMPDPTMQRQHSGSYSPPPSPGQQFMSQFWNAYQQGVINPQLAANQGQISGLLGQQQIGNAMSGVQQQGLQQQYGFDTARLGLQQEGLGVQQGTLSRQMGLLPQQNALQQQIFDIQQGQLGRGRENLESQYANQLGQFGLQEQGMQNQYAQGNRQATSSAVSSGAINTAGYRQNLNDLATQLSMGQSGLGLARRSAEQGYESGKAQLADQGRFLDVNRQQNQLSYQEQQAQQQDAQRNLDIQAKGLGLSGQELSARLNNALQQIGLSSQLSSNQVVNEIAKIKNGEYSILGNIIPVLSQFAGLNLYAGA